MDGCPIDSRRTAPSTVNNVVASGLLAPVPGTPTPLTDDGALTLTVAPSRLEYTYEGETFFRMVDLETLDEKGEVPRSSGGGGTYGAPTQTTRCTAYVREPLPERFRLRYRRQGPLVEETVPFEARDLDFLHPRPPPAGTPAPSADGDDAWGHVARLTENARLAQTAGGIKPPPDPAALPPEATGFPEGYAAPAWLLGSAFTCVAPNASRWSLPSLDPKNEGWRLDFAVAPLPAGCFDVESAWLREIRDADGRSLPRVGQALDFTFMPTGGRSYGANDESVGPRLNLTATLPATPRGTAALSLLRGDFNARIAGAIVSDPPVPVTLKDKFTLAGGDFSIYRVHKEYAHRDDANTWEVVIQTRETVADFTLFDADGKPLPLKSKNAEGRYAALMGMASRINRGESRKPPVTTYEVTFAGAPERVTHVALHRRKDIKTVSVPFALAGVDLHRPTGVPERPERFVRPPSAAPDNATAADGPTLPVTVFTVAQYRTLLPEVRRQGHLERELSDGINLRLLGYPPPPNTLDMVSARLTEAVRADGLSILGEERTVYGGLGGFNAAEGCVVSRYEYPGASTAVILRLPRLALTPNDRLARLAGTVRFRRYDRESEPAFMDWTPAVGAPLGAEGARVDVLSDDRRIMTLTGAEVLGHTVFRDDQGRELAYRRSTRDFMQSAGTERWRFEEPLPEAVKLEFRYRIHLREVDVPFTLTDVDVFDPPPLPPPAPVP